MLAHESHRTFNMQTLNPNSPLSNHKLLKPTKMKAPITPACISKPWFLSKTDIPQISHICKKLLEQIFRAHVPENIIVTRRTRWFASSHSHSYVSLSRWPQRHGPPYEPASLVAQVHGITSSMTSDFTIQISDPSEYKDKQDSVHYVATNMCCIEIPSSHTRERGNGEQADHHSVKKQREDHDQNTHTHTTYIRNWYSTPRHDLFHNQRLHH